MLDDNEVKTLIKAVKAKITVETFANINQGAIDWRGHRGECRVVHAADDGWDTQLVLVGPN